MRFARAVGEGFDVVRAGVRRVRDRIRREPQPPAPARPPAVPEELVDFLRRLSVALSRSDAVSDQIEVEMAAVARAYGTEQVQFFVFPTGVFVRIGGEERNVLDFAPAAGPSLRLDQISAVYELIADVKAAPIPPAEGVRRLRRILAEPPRFGPVLQVCGHAILTLALGLVFNGDPGGLPGYLLLGAVVGVLRLVSNRFRALEFVLPVVAALTVTALVFEFGDRLVASNPTQLLVPPLVTFLPGAMLTMGSIELARGSIVSGGSRLVAGVFGVVLLTLGIVAGAQISGYAHTPELTHPTHPSAVIGWWAPALGVLIFGIGQYVYESAPSGALLWLLLVLYAVWLAQTVGNALAGSLFGAFAGGLVLMPIADLVQRTRRGIPAQVAFLPAFLLLVPGALGLTGLSEFVGVDRLRGLLDLGEAFAAVFAITLGILVGASLVGTRRSRAGA